MSCEIEDDNRYKVPVLVHCDSHEEAKVFEEWLNCKGFGLFEAYYKSQKWGGNE